MYIGSLLRPIRYFPLLLVLFFLVTTIPFRSQFPINWDASQFVLGVRHFSPPMHQPHPPGYPLFIGLARIVNWTIDSQHFSVLTVTWIFGLGAVLALYGMGVFLWKAHWAAFLSALGFLLNPLFWYYRETALTYTVDAFATLAVGGLSYAALQNPRLQYHAAVALGLLAGVRPSVALLLAPLVFFPSILKKRYRLGLNAFLLLVVSILVWLIPLVALSGGFFEFLKAAGGLAESAARGTSMPFAGIGPVRQQTAAIIDLMFASCNLMLAAALGGACLLFRDLFQRGRLLAGLAFIAFWVAPPLLVFVFIHLGQSGYLLVLIPIVYVLTGRLWVQVLSMRGWAKVAGLAALTGALLVHGLPFLFLAPLHSRMGVPLQSDAPRMNAFVSQYSAQVIRQNDLKIASMTEIIRSHPATRTLVITAPLLASRTDSAFDPQPDVFRALGTTCPEYAIFHVTPHLLLLRDSRTVLLSSPVTIRKGGSTLVLLVDEIPAQFLPKGVRIAQKSRPISYFVGFAEGEFEFLGIRFQPAKE